MMKTYENDFEMIHFTQQNLLAQIKKVSIAKQQQQHSDNAK